MHTGSIMVHFYKHNGHHMDKNMMQEERLDLLHAYCKLSTFVYIILIVTKNTLELYTYMFSYVQDNTHTQFSQTTFYTFRDTEHYLYFIHNCARETEQYLYFIHNCECP